MDDIIVVPKWFFEWLCCGHVIIITTCGTMTFNSTFQVFTHYINAISCEYWFHIQINRTRYFRNISLTGTFSWQSMMDGQPPGLDGQFEI